MSSDRYRGEVLPHGLWGEDELDPIPMGPFEIYERIGSGAMGDVWRGRHVKQDVPVAIKVISSTEALEKRFQYAFRDEVRSMAALNHPGVAMVFDYGTIPLEAELLSGEAFIADSPYLAMELAHYGCAERLIGTGLEWHGIYLILLSVLDALSHSHARGVIHRDIKPGNILLTKPEQSWPGIKLADFGLAYLKAFHEHQGFTGPVGTPFYMAPEQLLGQWRDYGPWTDLYAVGILAFELVTGRRPFDGNNHFQIAQAHLHDAVPPLEADVEVPEGIFEWIGCLLEKSHRGRFRTAADAVHRLLEIGGGPPTVKVEDLESLWTKDGASKEEQAGNLSQLTRTLSSLSPFHALHGLSSSAHDRDDRLEEKAFESPPIPSDWRKGSAIRPSMRLVGAGLGLYGMRRLPLMGRTQEQERLWQALRRCRRDEPVRPVLLIGPAGVGKDYLVQWLAERALEFGAGTLLQARHGKDRIAGGGLAGMLSSSLGCLDLPREKVRERVEDIFRSQGVTDSYEWLAISEIIAPSPDEDPMKIVFQGPAQRYAVIESLLRRLGRERPVILWLSDVHCSPDTIAFVRYLIDYGDGKTPLMIAMTARDDLLTENPEVQTELSGLVERGSVESLRIDPLRNEASQALIEELLYLNDDLAFEVAQRTEGNPHFAARLVGDWVHRGVLVVDDQGFALARGAETSFPDDLYSVWSAHLEHLLEGYDEEDVIGLELAATLGLEVVETQWAQICRMAGVEVPFDLLDAMNGHALARRHRQGWAFAHGMLRETVIRRAQSHGRWREHNRLCAEFFAARAKDEPATATRRGIHLVEAELFDEAIDVLLEAADFCRRYGERALAVHLLLRREQALETAKVPAKDRRRAQGYELLATLKTLSGQPGEGEVWAARALEVAEHTQELRLMAQAKMSLGLARSWNGRFDEAREHLEASARLANECGDRLLAARIRRTLARGLVFQHEHDRARALLLEVREVFEASEELVDLAQTNFELAAIERSTGNLERARSFLEPAVEQASKIRSQAALSDCWGLLGDLARHQGDFSEARRCYDRAFYHGRLIHQGRTLVPRINLALLAIQTEDFAGGQALLEACLLQARQSGRRMMEGLILLLSLPYLTSVQDWKEWDERFTGGQAILRALKVSDPDLVLGLRMAAKLAESAGEVQRASRAAAFADELLEMNNLP